MEITRPCSTLNTFTDQDSSKKRCPKKERDVCFDENPQYKDISSEKDTKGQLKEIIRMDDVKALQDLKDKGVDIIEPCSFGSPIAFAITSVAINILNFFINEGHIKLKDEGMEICDLAVCKLSTSAVKTIFECLSSNDFSPYSDKEGTMRLLTLAAKVGNYALIDDLSNKGNIPLTPEVKKILAKDAANHGRMRVLEKLARTYEKNDPPIDSLDFLVKEGILTHEEVSTAEEVDQRRQKPHSRSRKEAVNAKLQLEYEQEQEAAQRELSLLLFNPNQNDPFGEQETPIDIPERPSSPFYEGSYDPYERPGSPALYSYEEDTLSTISQECSENKDPETMVFPQPRSRRSVPTFLLDESD